MDHQSSKSMYVPQMEHDACGIGFVAHLKGKKSHQIISDAITMLENMEHRGATGSEANTGDGAGILMQMPHEFFVQTCQREGFSLPDYGRYGVGTVFFPQDYNLRQACREQINELAAKFGFDVLGYRKVPTNNKDLGETALKGEPYIEQLFVQQNYSSYNPQALERRLFVFRKHAVNHIRKQIPECKDVFHMVSLSYRTLGYKGQLRALQLRNYFPDLQDPRLQSALAMIHSRFSTNTFPNWRLAQPFRFIAHNGEINTVRGNVNWMKSFETLFRSSHFSKEEIELVLPLLDETQSDSSNLDKVVELLSLGGRSLPHVMMMLIPEAWEGDQYMEEYKKAFYKFHGALMQPWDGPASICFTDGAMIGACLDRNGLRPSRYCLTDDDILIMGSEAGALPVDPAKVVMKGRLEPGKIFIADLVEGRIISDEELKYEICNQNNYSEWLNNSVPVTDLPKPKTPTYHFDEKQVIPRLQMYGFSSEDLQMVMPSLFENGKEKVGSMGADIPLAVLSAQSQHLSHYFKQLFAQVSNPPIDPIRERIIMSLHTGAGKSLDILAEKPEQCINIEFDQPVLTNEDIDKVRHIEHHNFRCKTIHATFPADGKSGSLEKALEKICRDAEEAIRYGSFNILLISDREANEQNAPIPSLLAVGAIHEHLIATGLRVRVGLLVEAGDVWEVHHFSTIIGFGGNAINPYMAFEAMNEMKRQGLLPEGLTEEKAVKNYIKGIGDGLLKVFSKMGISTLRSYHGAQIYEILGLNSQVVKKCFNGTVSRIEGIDFDGIAREVLVRHKLAYPKDKNPVVNLPVGGLYQWKRKGEAHLFTPESVSTIQQAAKTNDYAMYKQYAKLMNEQTQGNVTLRSLLDFKKRRPILLEEVESADNIVKRFATGAMSFGSISHEAHSTLAIAMNRIGAKSNSGEGGEDYARFERKANGDWERSAIKQVASARFGVSSYYLANASELQIKIAQGAKPGEGGQLPGHKVDEWIGRVRHSTPGVELISPPPHHDIYSIEDLKQLIFDLKNANPQARISVKLVSEAGVGTIAAGVAKAHADHIVIAGADGGTGASPISSVRHAGLPWELGIAEAHQILVINNLRSRVTLQTDGQLRTGRDLAIASLLGAEEWGVATAALVAAGCIMMRKCHDNTCPVGVATQDPELRKLFTGDPQHVINFFYFLANDLREVMAELGFRTINEMVGQADVLKVKDNLSHWKHQSLDLSPVLYKPQVKPNVGLYKQIPQDHEIDNILDRKMIEIARPALEYAEYVHSLFEITNTDRAVGTMLSYEISSRFKEQGLPPGTIHYKFRGSAGQSFAAWGARGLQLELEGEANDYIGKGLSGAELIVYPDRTSKFDPYENVIIGNVAFYGAIDGEAYIRGKAGQRFCVRNSGAKVVVEGTGDHGCEYMTRGAVVVLGKTGRNFAAGMSGGVAYVYDVDGKFKQRCNMEMVSLEKLDAIDIRIMRYLIEKHRKYTDSSVAGHVLTNWDEAMKHFVKVLPKNFRDVLHKKGMTLLDTMKIEDLTEEVVAA